MCNDKRQAAVAPNWPTKWSLQSKLRGHKGNVHTKGWGKLACAQGGGGVV